MALWRMRGWNAQRRPSLSMSDELDDELAPNAEPLSTVDESLAGDDAERTAHPGRVAGDVVVANVWWVAAPLRVRVCANSELAGIDDTDEILVDGGMWIALEGPWRAI